MYFRNIIEEEAIPSHPPLEDVRGYHELKRPYKLQKSYF